MSIIFSEEQEKAIDAIEAWHSLGSNQTFALSGFAGTGKAQPLDCKVLGEDGWVFLKDLKIGDKIFDNTGKLTKIISIHPQGLKDVNLIKFNDGTQTKSCNDHLWSYHTGSDRVKGRKYRVDSLNNIKTIYKYKNGRRNCFIPINDAIQFNNSNNLEIHPYILGSLISDGSFTSGIGYTKKDSFILNKIKKLLPKNLSIKPILKKDSNCQYRIIEQKSKSNSLLDCIRKFGLYGKVSYEKFIPFQYLKGSVEQRLELLQGLIDGDGTVRGSYISYTTTSLLLCKDVLFLIRSLGGVCSYKPRYTYYTHNNIKKRGRLSYRITLKFKENNILPFTTPRHVNRYKPSIKYTIKKVITDIKSIGKELCLCITVDNKTGLYLTDDFIVTHNSTIAASLPEIFDEHKIAFCAFTGKAASVLRSKMEDFEGYIGTIHRLIYIPKKSKNNKIVFKKRSRHSLRENYDLIVVDEASMVGAELYEDLCHYDIPILLVGDNAQLEPVSEKDLKLLQYPDFQLTHIHRQAKDNPIITFSKCIREGDRSFAGLGDADEVVHLDSTDYHDQTILTNLKNNYNMDTDIFLCGYNKSRVALNQEIRRSLGFGGKKPNIGEKIICLKNRAEVGIFNGMIGFIKNISEETFKLEDDGVCKARSYVLYKVSIDFKDYNHTYTGYMLPSQFGAAKLDSNQLDLQKEYTIMCGKQIDLFDYGYCVTVHKAQGSEYDNVVVIRQQCKIWDQKRWDYTAVTRASKKVVMVL